LYLWWGNSVTAYFVENPLCNYGIEMNSRCDRRLSYSFERGGSLQRRDVESILKNGRHYLTDVCQTSEEIISDAENNPGVQVWPRKKLPQRRQESGAQSIVKSSK